MYSDAKNVGKQKKNLYIFMDKEYLKSSKWKEDIIFFKLSKKERIGKTITISSHCGRLIETYHSGKYGLSTNIFKRGMTTFNNYSFLFWCSTVIFWKKYFQIWINIKYKSSSDFVSNWISMFPISFFTC